MSKCRDKCVVFVAHPTKKSHSCCSFFSVYAACDAIRPMGYGMKKEPDGGSMKGLAFALDPDGYPIEVREIVLRALLTPYGTACMLYYYFCT